MTKPIVLLPRAERDVTDTTDKHRDEGGATRAAPWVQSLSAALQHVGAYAASGSPRYADVLTMPGLRFWRVRRFPCLVFYVDRVAQVDIWRVLHAHRNIPAWLRSVE
ncbi:MAG: type II toxin-antitoxin system RelE/ParE family toxin [Rhodanobacteraceae bacterium]